MGGRYWDDARTVADFPFDDTGKALLLDGFPKRIQRTELQQKVLVHFGFAKLVAEMGYGREKTGRVFGD